ncbi:MAG: peptide methionine sulfoxide reductase MsrA [Bryobacteraceae bacterium]|jgi:peptide-methionine (S)-S-oxide reductase|nr:MAG: peptide methionine sulfoxide reductase MsrA [Bryobacteraceae bacterium]
MKWSALGSLFLAMNLNASAAQFPEPPIDEKPAPGLKKAVLAGGCFWCTEAVFELIEGVRDVVSGYSGGSKETANYRRVSMGDTGHAEAIEITYDSSVVTFGQLLRVFFEVAHDPTQLNRQGPDVGPQYRSAIFYMNDEQERIAEAYIRTLNEAKVFRSKIVTELAPFKAFYPAEDYHQDYAANNPGNPYIYFNAVPKVEKLKKACPRLVRGGKKS